MYDAILDHLTRVAAEHGRTALWFEALPWIVDTCGAAGGRIVLDLAAPARRTCGVIASDLNEAIDRWEDGVLGLEGWVPAGGGSLASQPPLRPVVLDAQLPLVHVTIHEGHAIVGGLSLAFATADLPTAPLLATANALVQSVARVATLASERYQLQRRLTQINLLYEVSRAISSSLEIDDVLKITTALAANALDAEASALLFVDHRTSELVFAIVHGAAAEQLRGQRISLADDVAGWVARSGQPLIVNHSDATTRFERWSNSFDGLQTRTILCAPLQVKGETLGVLEVFNKEGNSAFNAEDTEWLMALASQASVAIENARLYSTLREERDRIIQAEEEVRHHLARNLHDSAAQLLGSLLMNIEVARKLALSQPEALGPEFDVLRELAQQANQELRQSLLDLRPLLLESRGLLGALNGYINQQRRRGQVIEMSVSGELPELRNKQAETAVYLILQEALTNIRKHANAQHTWLRIHAQPLTLVIEVEDDGDGFAVAEIHTSYTERGSLGMLNMRERVDWLGGKINFISPCSPQGRGALVKIELPMSCLTTSPITDTAAWILATQKSRSSPSAESKGP